MTKKLSDQNMSYKEQLLNSIEPNFIFNKKPLNRFKIQKIKNDNKNSDKNVQISELKKLINSIQNCNLKNNSQNLILGDGNLNSPIMIIGEGPGQKEDDLGKPFVGDAGILLNKMLKAINIKRESVYITNVVNYRPPNNRKPETKEIIRYSHYLKEHISIINPQILILMGSTAMEAIFGSKIKITKERGSWKQVIIKTKSYKTMTTFHPAYLLRQPDQKKYSWHDLRLIQKEIDAKGIKL